MKVLKFNDYVLTPTCLLWQLNHDLLHCLYSEWLTWTDLSNLDLACLDSNNRNVWLSTLSKTCITHQPPLSFFGSNHMLSWYTWLVDRFVILTEGFPIRLTHFQPVVMNIFNNRGLKRYCPLIRSIEIDMNDEVDDTKYLYSFFHSQPRRVPMRVKRAKLRKGRNSMKLFLSHCVGHLKGITILFTKHLEVLNIKETHETLLSVFNTELNKDQLVKIDLCLYRDFPTFDEIMTLIRNHRLTLKDLRLDVTRVSDLTWSFDELITSLMEMKVLLRRLTIGGLSCSNKNLMDYLSSVGMYLEIIELGCRSYPCSTIVISDELLMSIGRSCPRLKTLQLTTTTISTSSSTSSASDEEEDPHAMRKPWQIFDLCPHLTTFDIRMGSSRSSSNNSNATIITATSTSFLTLKVDGSQVNEEFLFHDNYSKTIEEKEAWVTLLSHLLKRHLLPSSSKNLLSYKRFGYLEGDNLIEWEWDLVKSKLALSIGSIEGVMSEAVLIDVVQTVPHLKRLEIKGLNYTFTNASLDALITWGHGLTALSIDGLDDLETQCHFTDETMLKMIETCRKLEILRIPLPVGHQSVLAAGHLPLIREVYFECFRAKYQEMTDLLDNEKEDEEEQEREEPEDLNELSSDEDLNDEDETEESEDLNDEDETEESEDLNDEEKAKRYPWLRLKMGTIVCADGILEFRNVHQNWF